MNDDPLRINEIIKYADEKVATLERDNGKIRSWRSWRKWMVNQQNRFSQGKISHYQYYSLAAAFAQYLHSDLAISINPIDEILSSNYCSTCLDPIDEDEVRLKVCSNCRSRLSLLERERVVLPSQMGFIFSLSLFWLIFLNPKKAFNYLRYGLANWIHVLSLFIVSSVLLSVTVLEFVPRMSYTTQEEIEVWMSVQNTIAWEGVIAYFILNIVIFSLYTLVIYFSTRGSSFSYSLSETLKISSLIILPRVLLMPLYAFFYQQTTNETYLISRYVSLEQVQWLILNLNDYMGEYGVFIETLAGILTLMLFFFALYYTWNLETDSSLFRLIPMAWMFIILAFGVPLYL